MAEDRKPRETETRENTMRKTSWKPPSLLPMPDPQPGWEFRYIRSSLVGRNDNVNVSSRFREGWVPVKASDVPEIMVVNDHDSRFPEYIEVGGLILCKAPAELMQQRREYHEQRAAAQIEAVDRSYLREGDPRMPLLPPERKTRVSRFGDD